LKHSQSTV